MFGSLVKGLRIGVDLLLLLYKEGCMSSSLSKILCLPVLIGDNGLDKFLTQFEAAIDSDFPNYQVCFLFALSIGLVNLLKNLLLKGTYCFVNVQRIFDVGNAFFSPFVM